MQCSINNTCLYFNIEKVRKTSYQKTIHVLFIQQHGNANYYQKLNCISQHDFGCLAMTRISPNQFAFRPGRFTMEPISVLQLVLLITCPVKVTMRPPPTHDLLSVYCQANSQCFEQKLLHPFLTNSSGVLGGPVVFAWVTNGRKV